MSILFDYDPVTKTRKDFHWNESDESFVIESKQDVTACVELSQAEFNAHDERTPWKGDMVKAASIPMNMVGELQRLGIWYDDKALAAWLNDPANKRFRTRPGKL